MVLGTKKNYRVFSHFHKETHSFPLKESNQCAEAGTPARPHVFTRTDTYAHLWHLHHIQTSQELWPCAMTEN